MAHRGHHPAHAERRADLFGLSGASRPGADHFLQRDDVGVDVAQDLDDARRRGAAIHAAAAVNVVGRDPDVDMTPGVTLGSVTAAAPGSTRTGRRPSPTAAAAASARSVISSLSREVALVVLHQPLRATAASRRATLTSSLCSNERLSMFVVPSTAHSPSIDQHFHVRHRGTVFVDADAGLRAARPTSAGSPAAPIAGRCSGPAR